MALNGAMTTRQIFNLRWNNHTNNMLQVFLEQLASEKLVDVTLSCEGKFLKVHKIVLSACSPYFQELFFHHKEQSPIIIMNGVKFDDLKSVVNFMYCGEIEVAEPQMEGVLAVAEALQVKGLSDVRESYENRHRKPMEDDQGDDGSCMEEMVNRTSDKPKGHAPLKKKRKLEEETPQSNANRKKELDNMRLDTLSEASPVLQTLVEKTKGDWSPETLIKEETLELDVEVEGDEEEGGEEIELNWKEGSGKPDTPKRFLVAVGKSTEQGDVLEAINADDNSTSENALLRPILPKIIGINSRLQLTNEGAHSSTSIPLGNTARKTITCSQGLIHCRIPRPPNAFMVFANEWRRKLAMLHHGENNKDISIRLGAMWKKLPPDAKETYFAAARRADEEHKIRYPGYTYNPKEARLRKILRQVAIKHGNASRLHPISQTSSGEKKKVIASSQKSSAQSPKATEAH